MRLFRLLAIGAVLLVLVGSILGMACTGATGEQGPQGPRGEQGPPGPKGGGYTLFVEPTVHESETPVIYGAGFTYGESVYLVWDFTVVGSPHTWSVWAQPNVYGTFRVEISPWPEYAPGIDAYLYSVRAYVFAEGGQVCVAEAPWLVL